jgi:hypothetical protein
MVTKTLVVSDTRVLAEFIRQEEFRGIFEKRIGVPPDHMALLIRNGQFVDAFIGGHFSFGGIIHRLRGLVGGSHHIGMILADLKTFQLKLPIRAITKDHVEVVGVASIDLQINPERPQDIVGLMSARKILAKSEVLDRLKPHLSDRVLEAALSRVNAAEIRGNEGLQNKIQADVLHIVERVAGDLGLLIRAVSIEWAVNEVEREKMDAATAERLMDQMDAKFDMMKRDMARQKEGYELQIKTNVDLKKLEGASEAEIAQMVLNNELAFIDAREAGQHAQELKALHREIEKLEIERSVQLKNSLGDADHVIDLTERQARLRTMERQIQQLDAELQRQIKVADAMAEIEVQNARNTSSTTHIKSLQQIEQEAAQAEADRQEAALSNQTRRRIDESKAVAGNKTAEISAFAGMSPEQILAVQAGFSGEVAKVLAEQARSQGQSSAQSMALMREMVEQANRAQVQSTDQARAMFDMGMKGAVGVAAGAGGRAAPAAEAEKVGGGKDKIECPKCHQENDLKMRFCTNCGAQLRT